MKNRIVLILVVALLSLGADQLTKQWARKSLQGQPHIVLIKGYLDLEYHENPGAAFGFMRDVPHARYILLGVGALAMVMVFFMIRKVPAGKGQRAADVAFALVAGGAVGNMIDRVYIGRVVDFVIMHWQRKYVWPAYNVADAALVAGVILLILVIGRNPPEEAPAKAGKARGKARGKGKSKGRGKGK